jgi:hypothetical protein
VDGLTRPPPDMRRPGRRSASRREAARSGVFWSQGLAAARRHRFYETRPVHVAVFTLGGHVARSGASRTHAAAAHAAAAHAAAAHAAAARAAAARAAAQTCRAHIRTLHTGRADARQATSRHEPDTVPAPGTGTSPNPLGRRCRTVGVTLLADVTARARSTRSGTRRSIPCGSCGPRPDSTAARIRTTRTRPAK